MNKNQNRIYLMITVPKVFLGKILYFFKRRYVTKQEKRFVEHNKKVWAEYQKNGSESEILFELTSMQPNIISYGYLSNILAKKHNAKIRAYSFGENKGISLPHRKIYNSFNAEVVSYFLTQNQQLELEQLFGTVYPSLKTKQDVFSLAISGVWFGDLLYDFHLRTHSVPTVVINTPEFRDSLKKALYQYIYWRDYFDNHNVKAINVTHTAYLIAIPLRIAIQRGISAYQCNAIGCCYMTKERLWADAGFYDFPMQFREIPKDDRNMCLQVAKEQIDRRFAGEVTDMPESTKSAYTKKKGDKVLSEINKIKVLIAPHCFFDSPNGLGVNLFPDYYEWLTFLGHISEKTDYEWYIKTHPDFLPGNIPILEEFTSRYPRFSMIPAETSHHQIIEEGIDFVLTMYGTIGFEYAALGKTVINASLCNPHIAYNFNIHPRSVKEYENILMNLADQKLYINKDEVYEYYCMKHIYSMENWLFSDYQGFLKEIGGYKKQFRPIAYGKFLAEFSQEKHFKMMQLLENYIDSKEYCMQKKHYK